ncbi:MAG: NADH-quinone oxidoreductase subunit C/D [Armatimonadota bacterium]
MPETQDILQELQTHFPDIEFRSQNTSDRMPTVWVDAARVEEVLRYLKTGIPRPYRMLYDLTAIDERTREQRAGQPPSDFTVVYQLLSTERNVDIRLKVGLLGEHPQIASITDIWPCANWYECEVWDMFGVEFTGHPHLRRILSPPWWDGHPLRKEHPSRATEMGIFQMPPEKQAEWEASMRFDPREWGMTRHAEEFDYMFLNVGPHHPSTHGVLRFILQLDGQEIVDVVVDNGFHHRGQEKIGERQSWHTYIPYTDRVDYLGGVTNNFPYVLSVEALADITVPDRAKVIRIMLAELFRIASHLVFMGTFSQDVGMLSPVFYMFTDREQVFGIVEAITGGRMHPSWFRIGGVAQDLPDGWETLVRDFVKTFAKHIEDYEKSVMQNSIFKVRTVNIGSFTTAEGLEWGATGPMLRATGLAWDLRKARPYGGYEQFEFDIPTGSRGDSYDRAVVHMEEMRQSLRIIRQCLDNMPAGPYKADHPLAVPPLKPRTMQDIETLINHFVGVSWGPVIPAGEAAIGTEGTKGNYTYYLISDSNTVPYRARIRTPSYPHLQMLPLMSRGLMIPDLVAILGSIDFVVSEIDR